MADGDVLVGTTAPAGITFPAEVNIHEVRRRDEPDNVESTKENGGHYGGKTKKTKVTLTVRGELLEGGETDLLALKNTGSATASSPRVTNVEVGTFNEQQADFTLEAHYYINTASSWKYS